MTDHQNQLEALEMKVNALQHQVTSQLESVEHSLEYDWVKKDSLAQYYLQEQRQDVFVLTCVVQSILTDVEYMMKEEKEKTESNEPNHE